MQFQKPFSSSMLTSYGYLIESRRLLLFGFLPAKNHSVHLSMADSPLAAESQSKPLLRRVKDWVRKGPSLRYAKISFVNNCTSIPRMSYLISVLISWF